MAICKQCGQNTAVVIKSHTFDHEGGPVTIPEIKHYVCPDCGGESVDAGDFSKMNQYLGILSPEELDFFHEIPEEEKLLMEIRGMVSLIGEGSVVLAEDPTIINRREALEEIHCRLDGILEILDRMNLIGEAEYE